jgi:hypothetical protein
MNQLAARAYFALCLVLGRMLRSARYSATPTVLADGLHVRKHRHSYAPLFIWIGGLVVRILDTGVRVLPQRDWEERERLIYKALRGTSIRIDADGSLVLPRLGGQTLAALLDDPELDLSVRKGAIESAAVALAEFHRLGFTHGDAMAENVLIDTTARIAPRLGLGRPEHSPKGANWFDFETLHDSNRPVVWRRADDVRALLVTCLLRTVPSKRAEVLGFILDAYADAGLTRVLAASFATVWRRSLAFHLAQAPLSFQEFGEIGHLLSARAGVLESTAQRTEEGQDSTRRS